MTIYQIIATETNALPLMRFQTFAGKSEGMHLVTDHRRW
jgi:hypothetical protein